MTSGKLHKLFDISFYIGKIGSLLGLNGIIHVKLLIQWLAHNELSMVGIINIGKKQDLNPDF